MLFYFTYVLQKLVKFWIKIFNRLTDSSKPLIYFLIVLPHPALCREASRKTFDS